VAVTDALRAVTDELGGAPSDVVGDIAARVAQWLGGDAERVVVRSLVDGELVIEAADTRTATDLRYRADELARVVGEGLESGVVRRVRVVVRRA
jgi:predicted nucleic acid-binding Zn ribbon protein